MPSLEFRRVRSEEHTSELQSHSHLVCRLLLEKKKKETRPDSGAQQHSRHERHREGGRASGPAPRPPMSSPSPISRLVLLGLVFFFFYKPPPPTDSPPFPPPPPLPT